MAILLVESQTLLETLGGNYSEALAVNNSGQVVGNTNRAGNSTERATLWSRDATTDLSALVGGRSSKATGINDAGQVVGYSNTTGEANLRATLWSGGTITDLGTLGGADSLASGINNSGQIVGWASRSNTSLAATLWSRGTTIDLNLLLGLSNLKINAISDQDSMGRFYIAGNSNNQAFVAQLRDTSITAVPEPASLAVIAGLALCGLIFRRRATC